MSVALNGDSIVVLFEVEDGSSCTSLGCDLRSWVNRAHTRTRFFIFEFHWASGLGIGFWLRGVQPRTTVG